MKVLNHKEPIVLLLVCLIIFCTHLDTLLVTILEARNFVTAREMLQEGNWIFTTFNDAPRYQKPPLPTWLTALSGAIFGLKDITFLRLPAAIMGCLLVLFTYKFSVSAFKNKQLAFIGGLLLATSFYIVMASRDGNWDIFTHSFMMLAIYHFYKLLHYKKRAYYYALLAGLFIGCSFLSKGPVALYSLFVPFLIAYGFTFGYTELKLKKGAVYLFILLAIVTSLSWYGLVYLFDGETISKITAKETLNWSSYNVRPFYYYLSFFTQSGIWTLVAFIGLLYPYLKNKVSNKKAYTFTLIWTITSLILLSIVPEKKSRYLLPVLIPLALNSAFYIEYLFQNFSKIKSKIETLPVYFNFGLVVAIGLLTPVFAYVFLKDEKGIIIWVWAGLLITSLMVVSVLITYFLRKKNIKNVFYLCIVYIVCIMCFGMPLVPKVNANQQFKNINNLQTLYKDVGITIYDFEGVSPEYIWYYGKSIPTLLSKDGINIPSENQFGILVTPDKKKLLEKSLTKLGYTLEKVTYYDLNQHKKDSKGYRKRLYRDFYIAKKSL